MILTCQRFNLFMFEFLVVSASELTSFRLTLPSSGHVFLQFLAQQLAPEHPFCGTRRSKPVQVWET